MEINRHNYESFFLLYTDNELPVAERGIVEDFIKANPDLEEELLMLQQSVLKTEPIVFNFKEELFRTASILPGMQEQLLLHLDGELTTADRMEVEATIAADTAVEKEWNLLQQTKLRAEDLVFKEKHLLYRKQRGSVIGFTWRKLAMAAAVIGLIAFGVRLILDDQKLPNSSATIASNTEVKPAVTKPVASTQRRDSIVEELPVAPPTLVADVTPATPTQRFKPTINNERQNSADELAINDNRTPGGTSTKKSAVGIIKKAPLPDPEKFIDKESNKTIASYVPPVKQTDAQAITKKPAVETSFIEQGPAVNEIATTAAYTNYEENDNRVLFMDESTIRKSKLGGVFKKVKRVFERNTNISTGGNHLKIANLEFAIQ